MRERHRRATREDVARLAGTSVAVVSYVVNDGPRPVSPATRQKVLDAIHAVGYEPNTVARALASGVTGTYGLVVPSISNPFFAALAHHLEEAIAQAGKVLLLADSADDKKREGELVRTLVRRRTDGVLFIGVDDSPDLGPLAGTPTVLLDRYGPAESDHYSVTIDNEDAAWSATRHLLGHGYTRLAVIRGPRDLGVSRARFHGWQRALDEAGLSAEPDWILEAPFSAAAGYEAGRRLLAGTDLPRAVFVSSEQQAIGLAAALADAGLGIPDDVAVMSFDGTEASEYMTPRFSGVVQGLHEIAAVSVQMLEALCRRDEPAGRHVTAGYELRIRQSCGAHDTDPAAEAGPLAREAVG